MHVNNAIHGWAARAAGLIWFITDMRSHKENEIEADQDVGLVFVDTRERTYLSITAQAAVRHDPAQAEKIWKSSDGAWWSGPDDSDVCLLRVQPQTAELWEGPASFIANAYQLLKARVTGAQPDLGENRKSTVRMRP